MPTLPALSRTLISRSNLALLTTGALQPSGKAYVIARISAASGTSFPRSPNHSTVKLGLNIAGAVSTVVPSLAALRVRGLESLASSNRHFSGPSVHDARTIEASISAEPRAPEGITDDLFWVDRLQPTRCSGCGVPLQTEEEAAVGYVPEEKLAEFSGGRVKIVPRPRGEAVDAVPDGVEVMQLTSPKFRMRTQLLKCQRCFRMQHYRSIDREWEYTAVRAAGVLPSLSPSSVITQLTRAMPKNSIVLKIVDICDLELSVVPELFQACRERGLKLLWIVNRVDCLPRTAELKEVKQWVRRMVRQIRNVHVDDCILVSSATGFGFDALETRIGEILAQDEEAPEGRFIFVAGRVNAGKSTFVNRFLKFVGYKHFGTLFLSRAVGGATRSALPGTTLDMMPFGLPKGFKLIDTPGVPSGDQITNLLRDAADLFSIVPTKRLQPVTYALTEGKTLFVGAMVRLDLVQGAVALCTCYFSHKITLHICKTGRADDLLRRKACAFLYPPHLPDGFDRLQPLVRHRVQVYGGRNVAYDDISIGGLGWISVAGSGLKVFDVWVPRGVKIFRRPAMLPKQIQETGVAAFRGKSPRARGPRISARKRALAKQMREDEVKKGRTRQSAEHKLPSTDAPLIHPDDGLEEWLSQCRDEADSTQQQTVAPGE